MIAKHFKAKPAPTPCAPRRSLTPNKPANDNITPETADDYMAYNRAFAGAEFVPVGAKNWWIP